MAKQGMKRPDVTHTHPKNDMPPVPEIQGKAKHKKTSAKAVISGVKASFHESPISRAYPVIDNDVARDNFENDLSYADLQDL